MVVSGPNIGKVIERLADNIAKACLGDGTTDLHVLAVLLTMLEEVTEQMFKDSLVVPVYLSIYELGYNIFAGIPQSE